MYPLHISPPEVVQTQGILVRTHTHLIKGLLKGQMILYEDSHVLSMPLLNTNLNATQVKFYIIHYNNKVEHILKYVKVKNRAMLFR